MSSSIVFNVESQVLLCVLLSLPPQLHHETETEMTYVRHGATHDPCRVVIIVVVCGHSAYRSVVG